MTTDSNDIFSHIHNVSVTTGCGTTTHAATSAVQWNPTAATAVSAASLPWVPIAGTYSPPDYQVAKLANDLVEARGQVIKIMNDLPEELQIRYITLIPGLYATILNPSNAVRAAYNIITEL